MYTCLQILSVSVFEKNPAFMRLPGPMSPQLTWRDDAKQLILFNF